MIAFADNRGDVRLLVSPGSRADARSRSDKRAAVSANLNRKALKTEKVAFEVSNIRETRARDAAALNNLDGLTYERLRSV